MKFLVDENVKLRLAKMLLAAGHDVKLAKKGSSDKEIAVIAKKESRIIITHDNDYALPNLFAANEYAGIVLIKVVPPTFEKIAAALKNIFCQMKTARSFKGKLIVLLDEKSFWIE